MTIVPAYTSCILEGGGGTVYKGLYLEALPLRVTFYRLQVYERVGISPVEMYEKEGQSVISVCKKAQKGQQMHFIVVKKSRKSAGFSIYSFFQRQNISSSLKGCNVLN